MPPRDFYQQSYAATASWLPDDYRPVDRTGTHWPQTSDGTGEFRPIHVVGGGGGSSGSVPFGMGSVRSGDVFTIDERRRMMGIDPASERVPEPAPEVETLPEDMEERTREDMVVMEPGLLTKTVRQIVDLVKHKHRAEAEEERDVIIDDREAK